MEKIQNQKEKERNFFDNIETLSLAKDEFIIKMKEINPSVSEDEILQTKAVNLDHNGKTMVIICRDLFPEKYLPYIETHEKWEAYVARKDGYNLFQKSAREYKESRNISSFDDTSRQEFHGELSVNNYDFRHEYAVFKEFEKALKDGN